MELKVDEDFKVFTDTGILLGEFIMDCDGFRYYKREETLCGVESSYKFRLVADKLDEVNKPYNDVIDKYFNKEREDFKIRAEKEYSEVLKSGKFFQWYPGMSGDWDRDKEEWLVEYEKLEELRRNFTPF